jgi:hypothetical protein
MARFRKTMKRSLCGIGLVLAAVLLLMNTGSARADIILTLVGATPMGSDFQYTYAVSLTSNSQLNAAGGGQNTGFSPSNNFFTLYDIPGLVAGSETYGGALGVAGNTAHTEQLTGATPKTESPIPPDSATVTNITTYWTGPNVTASQSAPFDMGTFSFLSTNPLGTVSNLLAFTGASQKLEDVNLLANNTGQVAGPSPSVGPVPEPGTLMLLAVGVPLIGGFYYRRRS